MPYNSSKKRTWLIKKEEKGKLFCTSAYVPDVPVGGQEHVKKDGWVVKLSGQSNALLPGSSTNAARCLYTELWVCGIYPFAEPRPGPLHVNLFYKMDQSLQPEFAFAFEFKLSPAKYFTS